jgi:hypothetical protein
MQATDILPEKTDIYARVWREVMPNVWRTVWMMKPMIKYPK